MNHKQKIGEFGENLVKQYLTNRGYEIIDCNIKLSYFEIDIIAKKDGWFVFVEVKTRLSQVFGGADMAMSSKKIKNIKRGISRYILKNKINENMVKIDFISVDLNRLRKTANIKHYRDII